MTFFESLVVLLAVAVLLLQAARRLHLPYPTMLAAAGVVVALVPGAPSIPIDPPTALALFIAPVLIDAAYDFPLGAARKLLVPLIVFAVLAVLATAGLVAAIGHAAIGLPVAAALTLGAIVAPPDAAAATAILANLPIARRVEQVLKGESLFNDATALLLFSTALTVQSRGGVDGATLGMLLLAPVGGIAFGVVYALFARRVSAFAGNTVGGTLLQFLHAFAVWLIAERLHLSAVLATVAAAMTLAAKAGVGDSPRMRVHSFAVWTTVVFLLNVVAFLLMGMQARGIVAAMSGPALARALRFAGMVVVAVIAARIAIAFAYRAFERWRKSGPAPIVPRETFLVGWTGMRGLVTLATAFALPGDFPERDTVVLTAFAVVLATLVIQGATLAPLIRRLGIGRIAEADRERTEARLAMADAALDRLKGEEGTTAEGLRGLYRETQGAERDPDLAYALEHRRGLSLAAILAQRKRLETLRAGHRIGVDLYLELQEYLDWKQLAVLSDEERRIAEN